MEVDFTERPIGFKFKSKVQRFKGKIIKNSLTIAACSALEVRDKPWPAVFILTIFKQKVIGFWNLVNNVNIAMVITRTNGP